jgi:hypothetical protein
MTPLNAAPGLYSFKDIGKLSWVGAVLSRPRHVVTR